MEHAQATKDALAILRNGQNFQWVTITLLALVVVLPTNIPRRTGRGCAGLALYMVHWFVEIINALIQHFTGNALSTVPTGTSLLLLVGVGIELSFMFAIAGLVLSKLLPEDPQIENSRYPQPDLLCHSERSFLSVVEIFFVKTPAFRLGIFMVGCHPSLHHCLYPLLLVAFLCYDWKPKIQWIVIGSLAGLNALMLLIFAGILHWI